ncbi:MAG: hypothetical protein Q8P82_03325, partial [bacterium]|nr:hypothetical protein [bacterium]
MSNVNYSIVRGENDGAFRSGSFLRYAADGQGLMFAVFRLPNTPPSLSMAKQLQTAVERWSTKPSPEPHLLESAFESVIQELNEAALPSKTEKPNMQIIIGATSLDTLVITAVGHTRGAIIRPGGNNTFHVFDLLKALTEGHADEKIFFGELISGVFSKGDRLGLITADDSAIDAKSWKQMLATQPLGEIRLLLEQKFKTASGGAALALEVLDHARANEGKDSPISSIETLRKTEQTTEQLLDGGGFGFSTLGKSLFAYMKQFIHFSKKLFFRIRDFIQKKQSLEKPPVPSPEKTASSSRITVESLKTQVVKAARKTSSTIRNPLRITRGVRTLALQGVPNRLNALPKRARLIFFLLLCFGILFIQSIFLLRIQQSRADGQKA